jgi:hypothetical protein
MNKNVFLEHPIKIKAIDNLYNYNLIEEHVLDTNAGKQVS